MCLPVILVNERLWDVQYENTIFFGLIKGQSQLIFFMYSDFHTTYSIFPPFLAQSVFFMCDKPAAVRWSTVYLLPNVAFLLEKHLAHFDVQMCSPNFGLEWQHPDTDRQKKKKIIPPLEKVKSNCITQVSTHDRILPAGIEWDHILCWGLRPPDSHILKEFQRKRSPIVSCHLCFDFTLHLQSMAVLPRWIPA